MTRKREPVELPRLIRSGDRKLFHLGTRPISKQRDDEDCCRKKNPSWPPYGIT